MCDFKPGDEVTLYRPIDYSPLVAASVSVGQVYTVRAVVPRVWMGGRVEPDFVLIELVEADWGGRAGRRGAYRPAYFRKVQRTQTDLSIETFLTIKPGFEEPRRPVRAPAEKVA